jgi:hypothetical protein
MVFIFITQILIIWDKNMTMLSINGADGFFIFKIPFIIWVDTPKKNLRQDVINKKLFIFCILRKR